MSDLESDTFSGTSIEPREARSSHSDVSADLLDAVRAALTDEDEIAHGEAWDNNRKRGRGFCAYCDGDWPCRTQQAIDRLLARLAAPSAGAGTLATERYDRRAR